MDGSDALTIITQDGIRGRLVAVPGSEDSSQWAEALMESGERLRIPGDALVRSGESGYRLPATWDEAKSRWADPAATSSGEAVLPVLEERLKVGKHRVETGRVRVGKQVSERIETVDEPLIRESCRIERIPVNRYVEEPPAVRQEGDTTIIPVLEERLVVERRLFLTEEVHISKQRAEMRLPQEVRLRRERVDVERLPPREKGGD